MSAALKLKIFKDGAQVREDLISDKLDVGRGDDCVIQLDDRAISRRHVSIRPVDGGLEVEKRSEFAPLSVNGAECTRALVKGGDVIQIGPYLARVEEQATQPSPAAKPAQRAAAPPAADPPTAILPLESPEMAPVAELVVEPEPQTGQEGELPELAPLDLPAAEIAQEQASALEEVPAMEGDGALDGLAAPIEASSGDGDEFAAAPAMEDPAGVADPYPDEDGATRLTPMGNVRVMLTLDPGKANVTEFEIKGNEVILGRSKNCEIVLEDKKASRKHTLVRKAGLNFVVKDLDSANGTYLNGVKIQEQELSGDDVIRIGDTDIRFVALSTEYEANQAQYESVPEEQESPVGDAMGEQPLDPGQGALMEQPGGDMQMLAPGGLSMDPGAGVIQGAPILGAPAIGEEPKSLIAKFRAMDPKKRRKLVIYIAIGVLLIDEVFPDPEPPKPKAAAVQKKKADPGAKTGKRTFDELSDEQKRFVEAQHALSFEKYRGQDFDQALYEIQKIFDLVDEYKNSREIERYAKEGKRKAEVMKEETRKREEEQRLKDKIAELIDEAGKLMAQKAFDQAEPVFGQVLALDPENQVVLAWQREIQKHREELAEKERDLEIQAQINQNAKDLLAEGIALKEKGKIWEAIEKLGKVKEINASDRSIAADAETKIEEIRSEIKAKLDPLIAQAKDKEAASELGEAYRLFDEATKIDPRDKQGFEGMDRIRAVLNDQAKAKYVEAVVAESYSDFAVSKRIFEEIVKSAPPGTLYHERAKAKLRRYIVLPPEEDGGGSGGGPPAGGGN
ncbi:MAG: FHA domain-containing protein [Bdellovibrionales bacterium]|nr:FHA domain-containing protein [Bdellovibrionales bacterium]